MNETSIPLTHLQFWLSVLALAMTTLSMAAASAWWGAKLAMRSYDKQIELILESQKERKAAIAELQKADQLRVLSEDCNFDRTECGKNRIQLICGMTRQAEEIKKALEGQDEKRQQAVKDNADMFSDIRSQVAVLTNVAENLQRHSQSLENLIRKRPTHIPAVLEDN